MPDITPERCPTCGSDDPRWDYVRVPKRGKPAATSGYVEPVPHNRTREGWSKEVGEPCPDTFHATSAASDITPEQVQEALRRIAEFSRYDDADVHEFNREADICFREAFDARIATLTTALQQRDEEIARLRERTITLCGSTRFKAFFESEMRRLTLEGFIVISVGLFGHIEGLDMGTDDEPSETKQMLDNLHLRKIDLASRVHVINVGGYIGTSTAREIAYAEATGKAVTYLASLKGVSHE